MENEQLLIGIARFFICEWLVFAQPLFLFIELLLIKINAVIQQAIPVIAEASGKEGFVL